MKRLRAAGADVTGVNCVNGPAASISLLQKVGIDDETWLAVYPNAGRPMFYEGRYFYFDNPGYFADKAVELADMGASIIGGCCGTTPAHVAALSKRLKKRAPVRTPRTVKAEVLAEPSAAPQAAAGEPSLLDMVRTQRVAIVELDSPRSLRMEKFIQGARELKEAGATAVTLADNSLAILRVSNVAAAVLLKQEAGIMPLIHIACRDKNLIGLQSEAMGLAALGFRHLLAITGDPAKFGDHPGATSVYDVNSLGLIECLAGMNGGLNKAGRALNGRSDFLIGCAFNPNARNLDSQVRKLESKLAKGAHYVMTQPVFDRALIEETHRRLAPLGIPVFMGVMPLFSSRNAEFLHNEVPGITIPDAIREKFKSLPEDRMAAYGVEMARELTDVVAGLFNGIYLITPMLKTGMTAPLVRHFTAKPALS
jgi:homocysteine S-methyltransferase